MCCLFVYVFVYNLLILYLLFFFFKQKTAYEMRISDWSSDVCSSDLSTSWRSEVMKASRWACGIGCRIRSCARATPGFAVRSWASPSDVTASALVRRSVSVRWRTSRPRLRSEEHTSELQSLMRISYAVFCLKKKNTIIQITKPR